MHLFVMLQSDLDSMEKPGPEVHRIESSRYNSAGHSRACGQYRSILSRQPFPWFLGFIFFI